MRSRPYTSTSPSIARRAPQASKPAPSRRRAQPSARSPCLAEDGYYNGTPFHRIVKGFVIQGGDPTGTGSGGPGYKFDDEPVSKDYERGILAMANAGPNTNGSQFFIVLDDLRGRLPKNYTIFGRVTGGLDVVDTIANTPTTVGRSGENSTPTEPVTLEKVAISES
jgi:peptidylprolyl isomerase